MAVLLTPNSQDSPYVHQEVGYAQKAGKVVIPLMQEGVSRRALGMLEGVECLPFNPHHLEVTAAPLLAHLRKAKLEKDHQDAITAAVILILAALALLMLSK